MDKVNISPGPHPRVLLVEHRAKHLRLPWQSLSRSRRRHKNHQSSVRRLFVSSTK